MNRTLLSTVSAAMLALSLAVPSVAQVQLAEQVANQLEQLGIDETLIVSQDQVQQIENILNSEDTEDDKKVQINAILEQ